MDISNINVKRIKELLGEDKRLDGRKPFEYRDIKIETNVSNNAEGSARVKIGKTEVIVGVKLQTQEPYSDGPDEGTLMVSMEFSPISGERHENGPPKMNAIETARVVDRALRESGFIDWKKLCIEKGKIVWSIMVDIYCINDDGNVFDASAIGAMAALRLAKLPIFDKKVEKVKHGELSKDSLPLTDVVPFMMTFHKIGDNMLVDPNRDEEDASESRMVLALSSAKEVMINSMQKGNINGLTEEDFKTIVEESEKIYQDIFPKIDKQIKGLK
jgi:exosome complex component RRP42